MYLGAIISSVVYGNVYGARATTAGLHVLGWVVVGVSVVFLVITVGDRTLRHVGREAVVEAANSPDHQHLSS